MPHRQAQNRVSDHNMYRLLIFAAALDSLSNSTFAKSAALVACSEEHNENDETFDMDP